MILKIAQYVSLFYVFYICRHWVRVLPCLASSELLYIFGSVLVFHLTPNQLQLPWLGSLSLSGFFLIPTPQPYESIYRLSDLQPGSAQVLLSLFWFILFFPESLPFLPLIYKGQPTISPPSSSFTAASLSSGFVSQLLSEPICGSECAVVCGHFSYYAQGVG